MANNLEIIQLENKNNNLEEQLNIKKEENKGLIKEKNEVTSKVDELNNKLAEKDYELRDAIKEKTTFEKKVASLLDVLYGCPECGC